MYIIHTQKKFLYYFYQKSIYLSISSNRWIILIIFITIPNFLKPKLYPSCIIFYLSIFLLSNCISGSCNRLARKALSNFITESPFRDTSAETAQHPTSISRIPRGDRERISVFNPWVWIRSGDAADWNKVGMDPPSCLFLLSERGIAPLHQPLARLFLFFRPTISHAPTNIIPPIGRRSGILSHTHRLHHDWRGSLLAA